VRAATVDRLAVQVKAHSWPLIFVAKITLSFSIPALVAAGLAEVPWGEMLLALFPAEVLWTGLLVTVGYLFGHVALQVTQNFKVLELAGGMLFLLFLARYLIGHSWRPVEDESL
jgi:membrane protein DedA with SNARE-associated domain